MSVVLVDWLGRGGIAQCTEAWAITLHEAGIPTTVVTRPDRELGRGVVAVDAPKAVGNRLRAHRDVAHHAARVILRERPTTVMIQNHVIPVLERPVYDAARRVGARLVVTVHDTRLHTRGRGSSLGLVSLLRRADTLLAHSRFIGDMVQAATGTKVDIIPLPVQLGLLGAAPGEVPFHRHARLLLAVHFGILRRAYKGTATVLELARTMPPEWQLVLLGVGAPAVDGVTAVNRFVDQGELVAAVGAAQATLLPYRWATQSGAVVLAQALGSVPVASAVGGLGEQIDDGRTGRLLPPRAGAAAWKSVLGELTDPTVRGAIALEAKRHVWANHSVFARKAIEIGGG